MDGDLYSKVWSFENLYAAYRKARKGKRGQPPAASFEFNLENNLLNIQEELKNKTYSLDRTTNMQNLELVSSKIGLETDLRNPPNPPLQRGQGRFMGLHAALRTGDPPGRLLGI